MKAVAVLSCPCCGASNAEFDLRCMDCGEQLSQKSGNAVYPAPHVSETAGRLVGGCELLEFLGRGGMGQVYRARQIRTGRIVALKTVAVVEAGLIEGIRREIRALSALRHPDIVRILEHGVQDGVPWYAMEVVRGRTLRAWARQRAEDPEALPDAPGGEAWWTLTLSAPVSRRDPAPGPPGEQPGARDAAQPLAARRSLQEILTLVRRLCVPLAYLHGEGLVHRDLKPENILIRAASGERRAASSSKSGRTSLAARGSRLAASGWPVLVDFGLSTAVAGRRGREPFEALCSGAGTVAYMAPEQIRGEPLDARADLYSLGCVLYELLTARKPFQGPSVAEVLKGHLDGAPRPPSELVSEVPKGLDELILRLLAKEPRQRLGHADDVAAALVEMGAAGELSGGRGAAGKRAPKPRAYLYRSALAGREEPMRRLEAALSDLQAQGAGGLLLIGGESGVGKTRLLLELSRQAEKRGVRVLAGECVPGVVSSEPPRSSVGARLASPSASAGQAMPLQVDAGSAGSGSAAGSESVRVARGRSRRSPSLAGASGPLEALRRPLQALADICRELGPAETERLLGRRGKVLALYEPALLELPGQAAYPEPAELSPAAARLRLFGYLSETLAMFAGPGQGAPATEAGPASPLLLMLDDLQWADELTLDWLHHWLRARSVAPQKAAPLLIVGTYRSEEVDTGLADVGATHALPLRRLIDASGPASMVLDRLDVQAVSAIVGDMLALEPPPALFVRHLARHSEGNPFFVAEYLRVMIEPGAEARAPLLWRDTRGMWQVEDPVGAQHGAPEATADPYEALPLPTTLQELVARRLKGLGREARRLAEAAAVLGRESDMAVLRAMLRTSEPRQFDALDELVRRQVLAVPAAGRLGFVHDQIREVAYTRLRGDRRKRLHRAAAEAIVAVHGGAPARADEHQAALGRHWEEAGQPDKARPRYLAAARRATARHDHTEAERLYRAYLRLVEEPAAESVEARLELGEKVLHLCGRNEEALAEQHQALEEARLIGDRQTETRALNAQGRVFWSTASYEEAQQLFEQALAISREMGDRRREGVELCCLGLLHNEQGRPEQGRQLLEQSLVICREVGNRLVEGSVLGNLGILHAEQGRPEEARQFLEQAVGLHRKVGDRCTEGIMLGNLGLLDDQQGRMEQALGSYEQALDIHREVGDRRNEGVVLSNMGILHAEQGRPELVRAVYEQALLIHREVGNRRFEGVVLGNLGNVCMELGPVEEARPFYEQALGVHRELSHRRFEGMVLRDLMRFERLAAGDLDRAAVLGQQSVELFRAIGATPELGKLLCERGHLELAAGGNGRESLELARGLAIEAGAGPESELGTQIAILERGVEAFEAGEQHRLFRGELLEDIPEGLRRWLLETGQLPDQEDCSLDGQA